MYIHVYGNILDNALCAVCFGGHARRLPRQLIVRKKTQRVAHGIAEAPEGSAPIFPMPLRLTDELPLTASN